MKLISTTTRLALLLLCCLMCFTCFAGCNNDSGDPEKSSTSEEVTEAPGVTGALTDENGYKLDTVPTMNFGNDEITILCWNSESLEEFDAEFGESVIENSVFERDDAVEERLGIVLTYEQTAGDSKNVTNYLKKVQAASDAGDSWDLIASYSRSAAVCASKGLLRDLSTLDNSYLDFTQPWWSQDLIEKTSIGSSFFLCTGDVSISLVQMIYCTYFNMDMIEQYGLESPYDLVDSNEWTFEKMLSMTKNIYRDNNNSNIVDLGDTLGLVGAYYDYPALLHGCNVPIVERNATGSFVLSSVYKGEKAMDIMRDLSDSISLCSAYVSDNSYNSDKMFKGAQAIFRVAASGYALKSLSGVEFEYGCVPCPKYTADQDRYYSAVRQPISIYGIMVQEPDDRIARATATLECLASEGYRTTTPVVFEQSMKYLKATSPEMSKMLQLIRDTAWFDFARIYSEETKYVCDKPGNILRKNGSWETFVNGDLTTKVEPAIKDLCALLISNNRLSDK